MEELGRLDCLVVVHVTVVGVELELFDLLTCVGARLETDVCAGDEDQVGCIRIKFPLQGGELIEERNRFTG